MNSGRWPSSSDSRLMMTLMNCRVRSTIGRRIVVPGTVRELPVPDEVIGPVARKIQSLLVQPVLEARGRGEPVGFRPVLPARRQLAEQGQRFPVAKLLDQPRALVVDQEERHGMRVVDAAGGSREDVDERRGEPVAAVRVLGRDIVSGDGARQPGRHDQHGFLERRERRGLVRTGVADRSGRNRRAARDPACAPIEDRGHQRIREQFAQSPVLCCHGVPLS